MHRLHLLSTVVRIIVFAWILLLFVLAGFQAVPVFVSNDPQYINQASLQGTRSQLFAKSVLTIEYRPDAEKAQAISDLQVAYPLFQQEQAVLLTNNQADVQLGLQVARPDYLAIVTAIKTILSHPNQIIDPTQVDIVLAHSRPYLLAMSNIMTLLQQQANGRTFQLFIIEVIIDALLVLSTVSILLIINSVITNMMIDEKAL